LFFAEEREKSENELEFAGGIFGIFLSTGGNLRII
jgi:hypothetical protein